MQQSLSDKYIQFDEFDGEIKAAVEYSKTHQDDTAVNKLVEIKETIETLFLSMNENMKEIFDYGIADLNEEIVMAQSRCDEKKRIFRKRQADVQLKKEDYETPSKTTIIL
jgi:hypothetical protein